MAFGRRTVSPLYGGPQFNQFQARGAAGAPGAMNMPAMQQDSSMPEINPALLAALIKQMQPDTTQPGSEVLYPLAQGSLTGDLTNIMPSAAPNGWMQSASFSPAAAMPVGTLTQGLPDFANVMPTNGLLSILGLLGGGV